MKSIDSKMAALAFAPRDVKRDGEAIGKHSAAEILGYAEAIKEAINETLALWTQGVLSRAEMVSHVTPLIQVQRIMLNALRTRLANLPKPS